MNCIRFHPVFVLPPDLLYFPSDLWPVSLREAVMCEVVVLKQVLAGRPLQRIHLQAVLWKRKDFSVESVLSKIRISIKENNFVGKPISP